MPDCASDLYQMRISFEYSMIAIQCFYFEMNTFVMEDFDGISITLTLK